MNTPSASQNDPAAQVIRRVRRLVGDRIKPTSYVRTGAECRPALEVARNLLRAHSMDVAARILADGLTSGALQLAQSPQPRRISNLRRPARQTAVEAVDELSRGRRILATRHGATLAAPVRDAHGKIDVLATARQHGLLQEATSPEELDAARLAASDLAANLAFR